MDLQTQPHCSMFNRSAAVVAQACAPAAHVLVAAATAAAAGQQVLDGVLATAGNQYAVTTVSCRIFANQQPLDYLGETPMFMHCNTFSQLIVWWTQLGSNRGPHAEPRASDAAYIRPEDTLAFYRPAASSCCCACMQLCMADHLPA